MLESNKEYVTEKDEKTGSSYSKRRKQRRGKRKVQDQAKPSSVKVERAENDPRWYAASEQLLHDAFSISTSDMLGVTYTLDKVDGNPSTTTQNFAIPGICTIHVTPCPGISQYENSPVNLAASKMHQWLRHSNSGGVNSYDAADLMMYVLALDNCFMWYEFLKRAYGLIMTYNQSNRYMPKHLLTAMNLNFNSLNANLGNFRYTLNRFSSALSSFAVPDTLPYITRHSWLFRNVYMDEASPKAQLYMYVPSVIFEWIERDPEGSLGYLSPIPITRGRSLPLDYDEICDICNRMIQSISTSTDISIIGGDILKAYGSENLHRMDEVTEDYMVMPVPTDLVPGLQSQIENASAFAECHHDARIFQNDESFIVFNPTCACGWANLRNKNVINFHVPVVPPELVAEATRLIPVVDSTSFDPVNYTASFYAAGSEICDLIQYWNIDPNVPSNLTSVGCNRCDLVDASNMALQIKKITWMSNFDRHPLFELFTRDSEGVESKLTSLGVIGELDNYATIDGNTLKKMHDVALLSMFDVPQVAGN